MAVTTEEMVRRVRACGQSIVDNAESIAGDYRGQTEIEIHVTIPVSDYPRIRTRTEFLPEEILDTGLNTVSDFYSFDKSNERGEPDDRTGSAGQDQKPERGKGTAGGGESQPEFTGQFS